MRCKACNHILQPFEIIWVPERNQHEELCRDCRDSLSEEEPVSYVEDAVVFPDDSLE